jgi:hypothetical protein
MEFFASGIQTDAERLERRAYRVQFGYDVLHFLSLSLRQLFTNPQTIKRRIDETNQLQTPRTSGRARSTSTIQLHAISRISGPLSIEQCSMPPSSGPNTISFLLGLLTAAS